MRQLMSAISRRLFRSSETLDGYEQPELVDIVFRKTAAYEPQGDSPEMRGVASVLDFGGGCGLHYKLARMQSPNIRWAVVETPAMTARASELSTDRLRFFASIPEAAEWLGSIDVMYSNGALQYTADPVGTLGQLCKLNAPTMLWERLDLSSDKIEKITQVSNLIDNGPGRAIGIKNKSVRYELTRIPETIFTAAHEGYALAERGKDSFRFLIKSG